MNSKMTAAIAAFALMAVTALCVVPADDVDGVYSSLTGETVIGVGDDTEYTVLYDNHDYDNLANMSMSISYSARLVDSAGTTVSSGVSPSSGDLTNGIAETLSINTPDDAGVYTLIVEYDVSVTYTDEEGEEAEIPEDELAREDSIRINVVEPITLSVTLTNNSDVSLESFAVYFYVDGDRMDDSYTTVSNLDSEGSTTVSYEWITAAGSGQHTFYVEAVSEGIVEIEGLGQTHTFYIGDNDYTMWTVLLIVVIILLIVVMVWVYRKPVKNYGKPKSRR